MLLNGEIEILLKLLFSIVVSLLKNHSDLAMENLAVVCQHMIIPQYQHDTGFQNLLKIPN